MKITKIWLALAVVALAFFAACHKDGPLVPIGSTNWPGQTVKASFVGQVLDEAGQPIEDAVVRVASKTVMSDKNGIFIIRDQSVNSARAIITAFKTGYFDSYRTLFVQKNSENRVTFRLLEKKNTGSFTASVGGKVTVPGGAEIDFPAASITLNGQVYSGKVNVAAHFIDPRSAYIYESMPGDLRGIRADGSEEALSTFGMLGVEMTDGSGQKLEVASGQKVTISAEISADLVANAPQTVPLWHFSETEGIWVEEGSATKVGTKYVGEVSHFSWWNYDATAPAIKISGTVVDQNGNPLNVQVWACPATQSLGWGCGHGQTDSSGMFCGLASKDVVLNISVVSYASTNFCDMTIKSFTVGPFSADSDLGTIVVNLNAPGATVQTTNISGHVLDCAGQPVVNGYVKLQGGQFVTTDATGHFSSSFNYCSNAAPANISVQAVDWTNGKESQLLSLPTAPTVDFGDITACDDIDEYIRYDFDGAGLVTLLPGIDSLFIPNNSSLYGYDPSSQKSIGLGWNHNNVPANDLPLLYFYAEGKEAKGGVPSFNLKTNMTSYPTTVGQYLLGTFGGTFDDFNGVNHTVTGSYRVKRNW